MSDDGDIKSNISNAIAKRSHLFDELFKENSEPNQDDIIRAMKKMHINMQSMNQNIHIGTKTFTSPQEVLFFKK